jgi:D-serine deaminase-like pyridoxal phosphate-dependent protein
MSDMRNSITFEVSRTSHWDDETPPVAGARRGPTVHVDRRTFATPEEHDERIRTKWLDRGRDHGKWSGGIFRLIDTEEWLIDVDDLLAFSQQHGRIVVDAEDMPWGAHPTLEIYDDYRE